MKKFSVILAMDDKNGIGIKNELAWKINADMKYFKDITTKNEDLGKLNAVIIGRRTWESIPSKFKPLSDRINCIISKKLHTESLNSKIDDFVLHFNTFEHALEELDRKENVENIFVIGGTSVYNIGLAHPLVDKVYLTEVDGDFGSDRFVEFDRSKFKLLSQGDWQEENGIKFRFMVYEK
ncbi:MAG: dihydrofolate reductase [Candidatus Gracilibacteria bacterium]|nr:dihydrofolate reductase [Candidatus Gracilibacteria bacterium]